VGKKFTNAAACCLCVCGGQIRELRSDLTSRDEEIARLSQSQRAGALMEVRQATTIVMLR
jgi:hypothetical protein